MFDVYEYLLRRFRNVGRDFHIAMDSNRVNNQLLIQRRLEAETEFQSDGIDREKTDQKKKPLYHKQCISGF